MTVQEFSEVIGYSCPVLIKDDTGHEVYIGQLDEIPFIHILNRQICPHGVFNGYAAGNLCLDVDLVITVNKLETS